MIEARTMSSSPARSATMAMISSGALPKVAFSRPPTASPVRVASCSVACTIRRAIGTMASAAAKNTNGAVARPRARARARPERRNSQFDPAAAFLAQKRERLLARLAEPLRVQAAKFLGAQQAAGAP